MNAWSISSIVSVHPADMQPSFFTRSGSNMFRPLFAVVLILWVRFEAYAESMDFGTRWLEYADAVTNTDAQLTAFGVTRRNTPLPALVTPGLLDVTSPKFRVLVVVDEHTNEKIRTGVLNDWKAFHRDAKYRAARQKLAIGLVPVTHPDGTPKTSPEFPPTGTAYSDVDHPESHYLWRWIGMLAPDLVIVVQDGNALNWTGPARDNRRSLVEALMTNEVCDVGTVGAVNVEAPEGGGVVRLLVSRFERDGQFPKGSAANELRRRRRRSPIDVAEELSSVYGQSLTAVAYIPSLALIARIRLSELTGNQKHLRDVVRIVRPWVDGSKSSLEQDVSGSTLSGHLVFGELEKRTGQDQYIAVARAAADLGFDKDGQPQAAMPFHHEMSDAVFMGTPILVQVGRLTNQKKYYDMAMRHLQFMLTLNLRSDGLHQHSPADSAGTAWGRGNGFPALGLALSLSDLPKENHHHARMLDEYQSHLSAMIRHQGEMGMWHQVVDHAESYRELTVTCMTTFAIIRGLRNRWLDRATYEPVVRRAWEAIKCRIGRAGRLVDVCTGTGKQKSFRDYLDRTAILGRDDRGGAMALMVSTELEFARREGAVRLMHENTPN